MSQDKDGKVSSELNISVLYEDSDVVAVDKPAGIMVHEDGKNTATTVVDWFLQNYPQSKGVGEIQYDSHNKEPLERSGVVHRLDRDTSGLLLLAKKQKAHEYYKQQFQNHTVKKQYRAFVYGTMPDKYGEIDRPIGRNAKDFRKRSAERGARGTLRDALTKWEVVEAGSYQRENFSYVSLYPFTGRMHQLRVHLKAIDRPIVGDRLYAGKRIEQSNNLELDRLALHAYSLGFTTPQGEEVECTAPLPPEFIKAVEYIAGS